MAALFKTPKAPQAPPTPEPAPPPPTVDQAAVNVDNADRARLRKGRASTILVPDQFAPSSSQGKTLLGV
jgi:hypothetical protein